ncbi:H-NS family nucleoid-associated regulatory protein [Pandoraea sp. NPDC090278]|uniref:H-NS histone family protein n=1 Tax=Pandoraea sp. NPDC090278 TaxID=3364391 RepID=UPI00383A6ED7
MSNYQALVKKREALELQIEEARLKEAAQAISQCKSLISEFQLTAKDLGLTVPRRIAPDSVRKVEPIYLDKATGKTWSGRGRRPDWVPEEPAKRRRFLIKK